MPVISTPISISPIEEYLTACGGRDTMDFRQDDGKIDLHAAREYADKIKAQGHKNIKVEQRNNRVILTIMKLHPHQEDIMADMQKRFINPDGTYEDKDSWPSV